MLSFNLYANERINKLIKNLGDDSFIIRQQATEQLKEYNYEPIKQLVELTKTTNDAEIKYRCLIVINEYYSDCFNAVPSIWSLPKEIRYKNGEDLSLKYYMESRATYSSQIIDISVFWDNETVKRNATVLFYKDLIKDFPDKKDILNIKLKSFNLEQRYMQDKTHKNWLANFAEENLVPVAIEILIENEISDFFKVQFDPQPTLAPESNP